jgi:hypothetical protein
MNVSDFTYLLQHPEKVIEPVQTNQLEDVLEAYPYFQAARALHLKGLKNLNSFKYNNALKVTAAYTADRDILFDFITSEEFLQNSIADTILGKAKPLRDHDVVLEEVAPNPEKDIAMFEESEDEPLPQSVKDADAILDPSLFKSKDPQVDREIALAKQKAEEDLEIGQPIHFTKDEKYSFGEWLQLTTFKTIKRDGEPTKDKSPDIERDQQGQAAETRNPKKEKFDRIEKFISSNPKIVPQDSITTQIDIKASTKLAKKELMTETLAKVYLEQKKYKKAIQAYKILSLKYPEKSSFFADRIKAVKKLSQDKPK